MARTNDPSSNRKLLPQMAAFMKACADETRLRLINLLAREGEVCVCHLVDVLGTNQPKVSRHLAYLKRSGLVSDRKDGLWVHYRLSDSLARHASLLLDCLNACFTDLPEMQRDAARLQAVRAAQPIVQITRQISRQITRRSPRAETAETAKAAKTV